MPSQRTVFVGISELVQPLDSSAGNREPLSIVRDAAMVCHAGMIEAVGTRKSVLDSLDSSDVLEVDLQGRAVIPGFVDSHTHVVFAGDRIDEMAARARGETYESIAKRGGGIARSVELLRASSVEDLVAASLPRVVSMTARGTTTIEIKSGYGLTPEHELKQLQAIKRLRSLTKATLLPTVLAHGVPKDAPNRDAYIDQFCSDVVEQAARLGLARYCDIFVESIAYSKSEARRIAECAKASGLKLKLHVDQLRDGDGADFAAELGALSADHLECTNAAGAAALAKANVIATLLPGCALYLGGHTWPDGKALADAGCEIAIATDCNPGSSMISDLGLCATLGATQCGLTVEQALWAITRGGAKALGLHDRGGLRVGERADFVVVAHSDWRMALYHPGGNTISSIYVSGSLLS
jgi:imidazolonepropionase